MGQLKNAAIEKKAGAAKKGISRYAGASRSSQASQPIGWDEVDPNAIAALVSATTNAGDALIFGRTSDGGALSLTILSGNDKHREYWNDPEAATEGLRQLAMLAAM